MNLNQYQEEAATTAIYRANAKTNLEADWYPILGLVGEAGELANKAKKMLRDRKSITKADLIGEIGDCLWYISEIARCNDITLDEVASYNLEKLRSRYGRGTISGSGDNR